MAHCNSTGPRKGSRYHRFDDIPTDTFTPRTYQIQLLDSAVKKNSLLCLGCSESKIFLALMLAKELSSITRLSLEAGGKRTFFLTDLEEDVDLLCQTLPHHTDLSVSNFPSWQVSENSPEDDLLFKDWRSLVESNNILVCQGSTFLSAIQRNCIQVKEVNLIVFDNCHRAVEVENHPYVEIVRRIKCLPQKADQPHILGVTSAIAGTDCNDPLKLMQTISSMEETMFAYAETSMLILSERFGCRPKELIVRCSEGELYEDQISLKEQLEEILEQCYFFFSDCNIALDDAVDSRDPRETPLQVLNQCLNILNILGSWCASSVSEYFIMQLEKIVKFEKNDIHKQFLRCVITTLRYFVKIFEMNFHPNYDVNELLDYTTPKVRELVTVLRKYKPEMDFIIVSNSDGYNDEDEFSDLTDDDDDSIMSGSDDEDSSGEGLNNDSQKPMHIAVKRTADGGHERIMTFSEEEEKNLCGIVFVENRYIAFGLNKIIEEICSWDENLCFVKSCHITGQGLRGANGKQKVNKTYKRQEEALRKFRTQECNLVIATLELEEGIDIPKCNLVVRFDPPKDFRAYALSKGRARARDAVYVILLDNDIFEGFYSSLKVFKGIEQVLLGEKRSLPPSEISSSGEATDDEDDENDNDSLAQQLTPYYTMPNNPSSPHVSMQGAIALINRYCAKLPSDAFTHLTPQCRVEVIPGDPQLYVAFLRLPINSPIKEELKGPEMKTRKLAKMAVALKMCEILHKKGELDENLVPVGKEMFLYEEEEEWLNEEDMTGQARPGTTKRKQYYIKKTAEVLLQCGPLPGATSYLYLINLKLTGPITDEQNTRGRVIYAPEDTTQTLGILLSKKIPLMPYFPVYTRSGEVTVSIDLQKDVVCSEEEITRLSKFHHFVFSGVLHLEKDPMDFNHVNADSGYLIVPLNGKSSDQLEIEWNFVDKVIEFIKIEKRAGFSMKGKNEPFQFDLEEFQDAVVMPSYRNIDQPQHFYVAEIRHDLNPLSPFPSPELYKTFQDYYTTKYGLLITNTEQPLLDVDHTSARLNLLTPRYMNQKGVALPTSSAETKRARRENLQQKQILVPELCDVHVFPASLWRKTVCLPAILYRANYLLLAEELRHKISKETGIGVEGLPAGFRFSKLDFGFDTSPEKLLDSEASGKKTSPNSKMVTTEMPSENSESMKKLNLDYCEEPLSRNAQQQTLMNEITLSNDDTKTESSSDSDSGVASSSSSDNNANKSYKIEPYNNSSLEHKSVAKGANSLDYKGSTKNSAESITCQTSLCSSGNQCNNSATEASELPCTTAVEHQDSNCSTNTRTSVISLCNHAPVTTVTNPMSTVSNANSSSTSTLSTVCALYKSDSCNNLSEDSSTDKNNPSPALAADKPTPGAYTKTGANINATMFLPCSTLSTPLLFKSSSTLTSSSSASLSCNINDKLNEEPVNTSASSPVLKMEDATCSSNNSALTPSISEHVNLDFDVKKEISNSKTNIPGCEPNKGPDAADFALCPSKELNCDTIISPQTHHCPPHESVAQTSNHSHLGQSKKSHQTENNSNTKKTGCLLNGHVKPPTIAEDSSLSDGPSIIMNTLCEELSGLDIDLIIPQTSDTFQSFDTPLKTDKNASLPNGTKYGSSSWQQAWLKEMEANLFEDEKKAEEEFQLKDEENCTKDEEMIGKNVSEETKLADSDVIKFSFDTKEVTSTEEMKPPVSKDKQKVKEDKRTTLPSHKQFEDKVADITDFKIDYWNTADKHAGKKSMSKMYDKLIETDEGIYDQPNVMMVYNRHKVSQENVQQAEAEGTVSLDEDRDLGTFVGPSPCLIMQALTMSNANDFFSLERLETIGDSFLKYAITVYLYCSYPGIHEGKLSYLRSKQVSNYNLYRLGRRKGLAECMVSTKFEPFENWLPPGYVINDDKRRGPVPKVVIVTPGSKVTNSLRNFYLDEADLAKRDEAILFNKELEWIQQSQEADQQDEVQQEPSSNLTPYSLQCHHGLPDKSVADSVEALIGCYLTTCGRTAALIFMSWLGLRVLPKKKKLQDENGKLVGCSKSSFSKLSELEFDELRCPPSPMFSNTEENQAKLQHLLQGFDSLEEKIGYKFRDKSYLLQAFTHASYHYNTITDCYQRVEFLGDAILDYVITRHLYEDSQKYSPGILTDLRSALVNNNIFAALAVKWGFHKYFKAISPSLFQVIDKFVKCQKEKKEDDIDIDEEFRELSLEDCEPEEGADDDDEDEEVEMEIPKALGDIFESVAGAIYLDSGMSLDTVWRVYYRMMKPHIDKYLKSIPKSPVRELLETEPETAKFERPERTMNGKVRVTVNVVGKGVFSGVGRNYRIAKSAAAKKALRSIRTMAQNLIG